MTSPLLAAQPWFELQALTLRRLHPSWLPQIDAGLLARAGADRGGRRWLARYLAGESGLFGTVAELPPQPAAAWLEPLLRSPDELLADLGARALAPALRAVVAREGVLELRRALGAARYEAALRSAPSAPTPRMQQDFSDSFDAAADGEALLRLARRYGARELAAHAARRHAAYGDSARLSCEREAAEGEPLLADEVVAALLQERASD